MNFLFANTCRTPGINTKAVTGMIDSGKTKYETAGIKNKGGIGAYPVAAFVIIIGLLYFGQFNDFICY